MNNQIFKDLFNDEDELTQTDGQRAVGNIGESILHFTALMFLAYSAYHGIHAASYFAAGNSMAIVFQVGGILVIEAVLVGLHLMYFSDSIQGREQVVAGLITFAIGVVLVSLGIVADSVANAGRELPSVLDFYLNWGLPFAPVIMAMGALMTQALAPEKIQARKRATVLLKESDIKFNARLQSRQAEFKAQIIVEGTQIAAQLQTANELNKLYESPTFQDAIRRTALANMNQVMRQAGIYVEPEPRELSLEAGNVAASAVIDEAAVAETKEHNESTHPSRPSFKKDEEEMDDGLVMGGNGVVRPTQPPTAKKK